MESRRRLLIVGFGFAVVVCVAATLAVGTLVEDADDERAAPTATVTRPATTRAARPVTLRSASPAASPRVGTGQVGVAPLSAEAAVQRVAPAVVTVVNQRLAGLSQQDDLELGGVGTGVIIDDLGHIATNWHVIEGGDAFFVVLSTGESRSATLVGADPITDLAVIRMEGSVPAVATLGDSVMLRPGEPVLAIGSPLGAFTTSVTAGIVSALGRSLAPEPGQPELTGLIQHDAAINSGNSGGPLVTLDGTVVGLNTLGIPEENGQPIQGLFFAIPVNTVRMITRELIEHGSVEYPFLGVETVPVTPQLASHLQLPVESGVLVVGVVPGSPADEAGIQPDDIILAIGGDAIEEDRPLTEVLFRYRPGKQVEVEMQRGAQAFTVQVTLGTRPADQ